MFGIDWPVWIGGGVVALWGVVRRFKPSWAARVRWIEQVAVDIYHQVEQLAPVAKMLGWDKLDKGAEAVARLRAKARAAGVPLGTRELEVAERLWRQLAHEQATAAMNAIDEHAENLQRSFDKLERSLKKLEENATP